MLTGCSFQLLMGRIYTFYSPKKVFLVTIALFEIGSAICGAAPNSTVFIIGRAIAGSGSSGIISGAIIIIMHTVPLHKRPVFQGGIGAIFGVASVAGPLLGGVFTTEISWRWCFYINLPIGGVAIVVLALILKLPEPRSGALPWRQKLLQLDPIGTACFLPAVICLLLALQWGGSTYAWSDGRIIALFVLFGILIIAFIGVQAWKKEGATVPFRIVKQRSIMAGMWSQFSTGAAMLSIVYYVPIWFQAIKGVSAVKSGIDTLPLILSLVVASILTGILVTRIGYYTPSMISCAVIMSIGAGLLTTFTPQTGHAKWIGYQILFGLGLGQGMQQASLAAQAVLERKDAPIGIALVMFCQQLGGAVFVSVCQNVLSNRLASGFSKISGINPRIVVGTGATELRNVVGAAELPKVLSVYNGALVTTFQVALAMSCLSIIGSISMEWVSIKKNKPKKEEPKSEVPNSDVSDGEAQNGEASVEKVLQGETKSA